MTELLSLPDVHALARDCLVRAGAPVRVAEAVAAETAAAEAAGARHHGMEALLRDIRLMRYGLLDAAAEPVTALARPGLVQVDARHGFAAAALAGAVATLAAAALGQGVALLRLDRASDPGAMLQAGAALAGLGVVALALDAHGAARVAHPDRPGPVALGPGPRDALAMFLAPGRSGAPADSPLNGPVAHGAWIAAFDPEAAGALPPGLSPRAGLAPVPMRQIALPAELLEQIVTA